MLIEEALLPGNLSCHLVIPFHYGLGSGSAKAKSYGSYGFGPGSATLLAAAPLSYR